MRRLIIFILSIVFFQCSKRPDGNENSNLLVEYEVVNAIDFNLEGTLNYELGFLKVFGDTLVALDSDKSKIDLYSIGQEKYLRSVNIHNEGEEGIKRPDGVFIHNLDSIFCYSNEQQFVSLINSKAELIDKIELPDFKLTDNIKAKGGNDFYSPITYYQPGLIEIPFYYESNKLYFHILTASDYSGIKSLETTYTSPMLVQYSLNDISEVKFLGSWTDFYHNKTSLPNNPFNDFVVNDQKTVLSFYNDYRIHDAKNNRFYPAKSNFSKADGITFFNLASQSDPEKEFKAFNLDEGYVGMVFDPYNSRYYRIFKFEQHTIQQSTGIMPPKLEAEWSLIAMNEDFEVLGEVKFPSKIYNFMNVIPTQKGLLISKVNIYSDHFSEDQMKFDLIKLNI